MTIETKSMIKVDELTKVFKHPSRKNINIPIFANASFSMYGDKINTICGPSGSGKTTLLHMIAGLEPVTAGEITINAISINQLNWKDKLEFFKSIGYISQFPEKYIPMNLTVQQNLASSYLTQNKISKEKRLGEIESLSQRLNLGSLLSQKTYTLSGGELRRLVIGMSIINKPTVLLCDEPTANLDQSNKENIMNLFLDLIREEDLIIVMTTHDQSIVQKTKQFTIADKRVLS